MSPYQVQDEGEDNGQAHANRDVKYGDCDVKSAHCEVKYADQVQYTREFVHPRNECICRELHVHSQ